MGAPIGNQFWKLRSKHGRYRIFETPELLWEAACEYFEWCDENPLMEVDFRGKDADKIEIPRMRAYTLHALCIYLDVSTSFWKEFKKGPNTPKDFLPYLTRIEEIIYSQKFTGAAAGFLNPNIIARDLGLRDAKDITSDGEKFPSPQIIMSSPPKPDDEQQSTD